VRRDDDDISALRPYPPEMLVYHGVTVLKLFWERDEFEYGYGDEDDSYDEEVCGAVGHGGDFFVRLTPDAMTSESFAQLKDFFSLGRNVACENYFMQVLVVHCDADLSQPGRIVLFTDVVRNCLW
jgi:hypothetical protein